jgi:hypothetical protein
LSDEFERPIDKIIREARESGAFDDLPGKGKPIQWDDDSLVPEDQRMAHRLLKNNNFTLDWIQLGQEIEAQYEAARRRLERARVARAGGRLDAAGWKAEARLYIEQVQAINRRIIGYNLRVPNDQFSKQPYPVDPGLKESE